MKSLKILLLSLLAFSCRESSKEPVNSSQGAKTEAKAGSSNIFSITEVDEKHFRQAQKESKNASFVDTALIKKTSGKIILPIEGYTRRDSSLVFQDKIYPNNEEADIIHQYKGYYKIIDRHLLVTLYYEHDEYNLISKRGTKTPIWSAPKFSKDGQYFFCFRPYGLEGEPVGLQVWRIKKDQGDSFDPIELVKILELDQLMFNPIECLWDRDGDLLIKAEKMEDNFFPKEPSEEYYLKLKYK
ncbi:hypothetical protein AHMF7605_01565 [Adhaeribacter arboris]|uniref:Lipoprotein n=1 Tax=Adhaeribacter arboris TaxID=2072846 RepID=A0A2T2Y9U5_9BACT|nr:hypothetical protein [Adhaeribacter arboris]PSR52300.1 hypothetical protein AHMF7605_01565 [Adhaeribacter arboris]